MNIGKWMAKKGWKRAMKEFLALSPNAEAVSLITDKGYSCTCPESAQILGDPTFEAEIEVGGERAGYLAVWGRLKEEEISFWKSVGIFMNLWLEAEHAKRAVTEELLDKYREISFLDHISSKLAETLDADEVGTIILKECQKVVREADHGGIFVYDDRKNLKLISCFGEREVAEKIAESRLFQEVVSEKRAEVVNQLALDERWDVFIPKVLSIIVASLFSSNKVIGGLFLAGSATFDSLHLKRVGTIASLGSTALANVLHFVGMQRLLEAIITSLATAIDSRDPCTAGHSRRTAQYVLALAEAINRDEEDFPHVQFTPSEMREMYYAALLHDVGKIGVKEDVLNKATRLPEDRIELIITRLKLLKAEGKLIAPVDIDKVTERLKEINRTGMLKSEDKAFLEELRKAAPSAFKDEDFSALSIPKGNLLPREWKEIKKHPYESYRILERIPFPEEMSNLRLIVRQHHERLDGSGYPDGLGEDQVLLQSRILAVCDVYDALTASDRPYKKALSVDAAVKVLKEEAESGKLDKKVVKVFIRDVLGIDP